jgi:hypothetical protein
MPFDNLPVEVSNPTAEAIARAIELLETKGWRQNVREDADGQRCLIGALAGNDARAWPALEVIRAVHRVLPLPFQRGPSSWTLIGWNDVPGRTKHDVLRLLRRAHRNAVRGGQHAV